MHFDRDPKEILAAAPDALAPVFGRKVNNPHPFASDTSLSDIAYAAGSIARTPMPYEDGHAVMARGMGTSDFSRLLAESGQHLVTRVYQAQATHLSFCGVLESPDLKPIDLPVVDMDLQLERLEDGAEISAARVSSEAGALQAQIATFGRRVCISRRVVVNDQHSFIARLLSGLGSSSGRLEARLVAQALEADAVLDDGGVTFDPVYLNIVADALTGPALGVAMGYLRKQPLPNGGLADLAARHLVVAPDLEYAARQIVIDAGLDMEVHALAHLPDGRWYLLANQEVQPTVAILRIRGEHKAVRVEASKRPNFFDGFAVRVLADLGAVVLGRVGIVKGGA